MKHRVLLMVLTGLIAAVLFVNLQGIDWLKRPTIQIGFRNLPASAPGAAESVVFFLNRQTRLTQIKVVLAEEARTNRHPRAVWELVSSAGSAPVTHFVYGSVLPGMSNRYPGLVAEKLDPGLPYQIILHAGKAQGQREFILRPSGTGR